MKNLFLSKRNFLPEFSFLILRFFTGIMMCYFHGWQKLIGGPERWAKLGNWLSGAIGQPALDIPLGFMAVFAESIGALFLAFGLLTRPMSFLLAFTMMIATLKNFTEVGLQKGELSFIFFLLALVVLLRGSGKYSLDKLFFK